MMYNWLNLKHLHTNASDYYAQFQEMKLRWAVREEQWVTVTRFINGLRDDFKGEVRLHHPESLMEAYQKALEIEKYKAFLFSQASASRCPNRALTIGLDTLEDDDQIDETVYPVVGDTATESEHEDDERESHLTIMRCRPQSDNSWAYKKDMRRIAPDLLDGLKIFGPIAVLALTVLLPVNWTGRWLEKSDEHRLIQAQAPIEATPKDRTVDSVPEKMVGRISGETLAAGKFVGDRKPPQSLPAGTATFDQPKTLIGKYQHPPLTHRSEENQRVTRQT
ncbi:hypothetical protein Cgig2_009693 [Carnegiea gigantea]|uniref:Retrotransposon gag domain-containing protein n=1 Tax=Carnegiea gigantea TaxID=171969 RepID=A0A9Q1QCM6_9CARY|nr:hypothetical protein Cgig2_009693 [Carnegiea gigantea]